MSKTIGGGQSAPCSDNLCIKECGKEEEQKLKIGNEHALQISTNLLELHETTQHEWHEKHNMPQRQSWQKISSCT